MNGDLRLVETPIVEIEHLSKNFAHIHALNDVNLEIPEGRIIGVLGPNGSGKTTLLKILAGLYGEYQGRVLIDGETPGARTKAFVSYLPDKSGIPADMPVNRVIGIYHMFFEDFDEEKCRHLLKVFGIGENQTPAEMSKGMIDKLQIALVLSRNARLYLLDEPIGGVDALAREHVLDQIRENFNPKGSMLIVTHLVHDMERLFDSIIVLKEGKIERFADADVLREEYGNTLEGALKEMIKDEEDE